MRLLPREWEGLHEAFPKLDEEIDLRGPILAAGAFATICGGTSSLIWAGLNLLRRRPFGDPNFLLRGPGFLILPVTAAAVLVHERERVAWSADIKSVLENDGISMPPRRYFQRTSAWSFEDSAFAVGSVAAIVAMFNGGKRGPATILGAYAFGTATAVSVQPYFYPSRYADRAASDHSKLLRASKIWKQRTGKEPPAWLYPIERYEKANSLASGDPSRLSMNRRPSPDALGLTLTGTEGEAHSVTVTPDGDEPHKGVIVDGVKGYAPQRDYDWNPQSVHDGLAQLKTHLEDLNRDRARHTEEAEFLWNLIALREAQNFPLINRQVENPNIQKEAKILELLCSLHQQSYEEIARLDWCIANAKKMVLQIETDGAWQPNPLASSRQPSSGILKGIRNHKQGLEEMTEHLEEMLAASEATEDEKREARRQVSGNLAATTELLEDLEAKAKRAG